VRGTTAQSLHIPGQRGGATAVAWTLYSLGVYGFLYAPLACLAVLSFNDTPNITLPWQGFTFRWYGRVFENRELHAAFWNSVSLGLVTVAISVPVAVLAVYTFRRRFRLRPLLFNLVLVGLIAPPIIVGVAQNIFWNVLGFPASLYGSTLLGHVTYTTPFVFVVVYPSFYGFDRSIEEAALDLGAGKVRVFLTIVLPIVKPGVVASAVFAFMLSFDEFIRTFFLIGVDNTLPIYLWSMMLTRVSPETNAIATLLIVLSLSLMLIGYRLVRQGYR
jgi:spermidine/putrescine transport system permease protein